jgi:two-component system, NarL family, invasion response regulator UvrY
MDILLADDHPVLRKGLVQVIRDGYPDARFGEAATTAETIEMLAARRWDVLVLDIFMPGRSGLDVLAEVRRTHPELAVLVLSGAPEEQLAVRVLRAGASGYLNKKTAPEELVHAIRRIRSGRRYVSPTVADRLVAELDDTSRGRHASLSDREYLVLQMFLNGKSIKEIADDLGLSPKTISTFHVRIWEKLRVKSDVEMIRYAVEHGMGEATLG